MKGLGGICRSLLYKVYCEISNRPSKSIFLKRALQMLNFTLLGKKVTEKFG